MRSLEAEFDVWRATMSDGPARLAYLRTDELPDGRLQLLFGDRLEGTVWHIREDAMLRDILEHGGLAGWPTPQAMDGSDLNVTPEDWQRRRGKAAGYGSHPQPTDLRVCALLADPQEGTRLRVHGGGP